MFCSCENLDFEEAVKESTRRIHIGSKIIDNVELSSRIITWHKLVANKWSNTVEWCNCRSTTVTMGATLVEGVTLEIGEWYNCRSATVSIGATLVEGTTLAIAEWCNSRRRNSVDWSNTRGRRNTGDWWTMHLMRRNSGDWCNPRCLCCWNQEAIVLTQRELRSSDGRRPVPPRSVPYGKHTVHN